jgi:hypothetical protein
MMASLGASDTAQGVDMELRRKALDDLAPSPSMKEPAPKPGEKLKPDSGYPSKFIEDYNHFQEQYEKQHEENPEYYNYAQDWWSQVRGLVDRQKQQHEELLKGSALDKLRKPFERGEGQ